MRTQPLNLITVLGVVLIAGTAWSADETNRVGRDFVCKPTGGVQTCHQGALLVDDVTMAILAGAPDHLVIDTAKWITQKDFSDSLGYTLHTQRVTQIALRDGLRIDPVTATIQRRAEVARATRFLIPLSSINTRVEGNTGFAKLFAKEMDSRTRYSAAGADICTTTQRARFCVRLPDVTGLNFSQMCNRTPAVPVSVFDSMLPHFNGSDWNRHTMLAVEVEMINRTPIAIDGARIVTARPISLLVYNLGYVMGSKSAVVVPSKTITEGDTSALKN